MSHTAPESVKRVKSSAQILDKSFFWRLSATNALGGSSGHQWTPFLTGVQLGLNFFGKIFVNTAIGVQPPSYFQPKSV